MPRPPLMVAIDLDEQFENRYKPTATARQVRWKGTFVPIDGSHSFKLAGRR